MDKPSGYAAYATELSRWEPDELFNAAKAMRELRQHPGWALLTGLADYRLRHFLAKLDPPNVHDQATYAALHGQRSGVQQLLDAPQAVMFAAEELERKLAEQVRQEA